MQAKNTLTNVPMKSQRGDSDELPADNFLVPQPPDSELLDLWQAQKTVDEWIRSVGVRYFSELTNMTQLVEEVGELARIMSRKFGEQSFKPGDKGQNPSDLPDEIADVLFVLICIANQTGVDLTAALKQNLAKKTHRDQKRHQENPKLANG